MKTNSVRKKRAAPATPVARWQPSVTLRRRADLALRLLLFLYTCLAALPLRFHAIANGLDPSWAFALNYAHDHGLVFGKEAGFTYGPLAYLAIPMPVGRNLAAGIVFQLAIWAIFAAVLAWFTFRRRIPLVRLLLFAAGLVLGAGSFRVFGYAGVDTFLVFLALLLAGGALVDPRWYVFYGGALALGALLFFIKFSSAISVMSALTILVMALFFSDRRKAWPAAAGLAAWPLAVALIGCFAIAPSPAAWWRYVRLGLDISSGYSVTMSLVGSPGLMTRALLILLAWLLAVAVLYWRKAASWPLALACTGPLFLEFKHSFVREAGHFEIVFFFVPLLWAAVALFTEFRKKDAWYLAAAMALPAAAWYPMGASQLARLWHPALALRGTGALAEVAHYPALRQRLEGESTQALSADRLPQSLLARVGDRSVAPFPTECSYAAANRIDMRLFPLFQMYQAYTPFLDGLNGEFLEDPRRAPEFIVVDWDAIDERHPLLDVPATTLAMYRHYDFDSKHGAHMLLRRRAAPRFGEWRTIETRELRLDQPLRIPPSDHPLAGLIHLRWNPRGQLLKFFFRLPEVRLIASSASGRVLSARVPPEGMAGGVPLDFLPFDFDDARTLFADAPIERVEAISIAGPGARYLEPSARVDIQEAADARLTFAAPPAPDFAHLRHLGALDTWRIEMMNDAGATGFSRLTVPDSRGYLRVSGWAVVNDDAAGGVWIELDGKLRVTRYGETRPDIGALFHRADPLACGFECTIPAWELDKTWHVLTVKVLARDRSGYYDGGRTLRFKME